MSRAPDTRDDAFYRPSLSIGRRPAGASYFVNGFVTTDLGIVGVHVWDYRTPETTGMADRFGTQLDFIHRGRHHRDTYSGRHFTDRGLVTVAGRMARRIVRGAS